MRFSLKLKHQILLAPAVVLLLMTLQLGFLQYTYMDLKQKRQIGQQLGMILFSLTEANMAAQRMYDLARQYSRPTASIAGVEELERLLGYMEEMHAHLAKAVTRILPLMELSVPDQREVLEIVESLSPRQGFDPNRVIEELTRLQPHLAGMSKRYQTLVEESPRVRAKDIDQLVDRAALVSVVVVGVALSFGILLSLFFARRLLRRVQTLSASAGRIARGDLTPPSAPRVVKDELDDLAVSINRMTEQLIRVVGTEKLLEGAEEERRRIAMDIHDQTLSDLSAILRGLQTLPVAEEVQPEVRDLEEDLVASIANLRQLMDNLHPQTLDILGLGAALESHLERHLGRGDLPEYHLYINPEVDSANLSRLQQLTLYRIAVEAIHNIIKHARATRYEVNLDRRDGQVVLTVEDNGIGFDTAQAATSNGGRGLYNIRERARAIGAQARWSPSRFSSGTRFELSLPVAAELPQE